MASYHSNSIINEDKLLALSGMTRRDWALQKDKELAEKYERPVKEAYEFIKTIKQEGRYYIITLDAPSPVYYKWINWDKQVTATTHLNGWGKPEAEFENIKVFNING